MTIKAKLAYKKFTEENKVRQS